MNDVDHDRDRVWVTIADPEQAEAERQRFNAFLTRNPSTNLKGRDDPPLSKSIAAGLQFRVQTRAVVDSDGLAICAQAGVFEGTTGRSFEIGAINVAESHQGLRLQKLLMRTAIIRIIEQDVSLLHHPDFLIFAAVADTNERSWRSIEGVGFVQPRPDHSVWSAIGQTAEAFKTRGKRIYILPLSHIPQVRTAMAEFASEPYLKGAGREVHVLFGAALERYAAPKFYETFTR